MSSHVTALANARLAKGEAAMARGDFQSAREQFDQAVDAFLLCGFDLRADRELQAHFRETIERVHRFQRLALGAEGDSVWPLQAYEATSDDFRAEDLAAAAAGGELSRMNFLARLGELQRQFKVKYQREFTLTGRDTAVHRRLYGYARAADVRVNDLTSQQVSFIVNTAPKLGIRVLDFSTMERVLAHNQRVLELGRPADTLATGMHLHLDDRQ